MQQTSGVSQSSPVGVKRLPLPSSSGTWASSSASSSSPSSNVEENVVACPRVDSANKVKDGSATSVGTVIDPELSPVSVAAKGGVLVTGGVTAVGVCCAELVGVMRDVDVFTVEPMIADPGC